MQKILVTGASGFVGSCVTRKLQAQGRTVAILSRNAGTPRRLASLIDQVHVIRGDIERIQDCAEEISRFRPEGVVHLAWNGVKGVDRNSPMQVGNIAATLDLYRLAEVLQCQSFIGLGSQAEYGPAPGRLDELAAAHPTTVYGAAKLASYLVMERMAAASGQPFAWLRLFSSYGEDDDPSWLLPYLARSFLAGQRPAVTPAEQRWDYIHVDDVADAIVSALDGRARGVFNLGSGRSRPLREVILMLRDLVDPGLDVGFGEVPYRADQVMHLEADITALHAATGWSPKIELAEGLRRLVEWERGRLGR